MPTPSRAQLLPKGLAKLQGLEQRFNALVAQPPPNGSIVWEITANSPAGMPATAAGTYTWTCPAGVTSLLMQCWGAGAGGGGGTSAKGGEGGGGGEYFSCPAYPVTPGQIYSYTVGAGGSGGTTGNPGQPGTASSFDLGSALGGISANGGNAGSNLIGGSGGTGGSAPSGLSSNGQDGGIGGGDGTQSTGGCGGGGSAGNADDGGDGATSGGSGGALGGLAGSIGGGAGGAGGNAGVSGSNGASPGAGGGGAGAASAAGQVTHVYNPTLSGTWNGSDAIGGGANQLANSTPSDGTLHQGGVSGSPGNLYGTQKSGMILPSSIASDLATVTIDRVTLTLTCLTTYSAWATVKLGYATFGPGIGPSWTGLSPAITQIQSFTAFAGVTTVIDLTAATGFLTALKAGTATALTFGLAPALDTSYRCSFAGAGGGTQAPVLTVYGHTAAAPPKGGNGADGTVSGQYLSVGGANTLLASNVAPSEAQDQYGNWLLPGLVTYGPDTITGSGYIAMQLQQGGAINWYKASAMTGSVSPWSAIGALQWWNPTTGFLIQAGTEGVEIQAIGGTVTLSGRPSGLTNAAFSGTFPIVQTDTTAKTNANNGTQLMTVAWAIPANDAVVGTIYEVEAEFNGTFETATLGFKPNLSGTVETTSGGDTIGGGFFSAGQAFSGHITLKAMITTAGSSGKVSLFIDGGIGINANRSSGSNNNNAYLSSQSTSVAFDTTSAQTIAISSVWGSSVASQTVSCGGSQLTRKGP